MTEDRGGVTEDRGGVTEDRDGVTDDRGGVTDSRGVETKPYTTCMKPGVFPDLNAQCVYCTDKAIAFLASQFPQLSFDVNIALVQMRYHCFRQLRIFSNFHSRPYTRCMKPGVFAGS